VLGLLALVAWWRWPDAIMSPWSARTSALASTRTPAQTQDHAATANPAGRNGASGSGGGNEGKDASATCYFDYRRNLRGYRDGLAPARNADEAVGRLMLDILAAAFDDYGRDFHVARQRWPNDLELSWLAFGQCSDGCDQDAEVRHLLSVDPDNAAAWMVAMSAARSDHDEQGFAYALRRAANAKIYDSRMGVVFLHARSLLAEVSVPDSCRNPQELVAMRQNVGREPIDDDFRDITAFAMEAAIGLPNLRGMTTCIPRPAIPGLPDAQRRQCKSLLSRVAAQDDTILMQQAAVRGLLELETDPARLARWRERYRQLQWLQKVTFGNPTPEHYATRVWSQGEVNTMQVLAMERGLWPPPPDWLPDDPQSRAFITGEPPPD
jgi:hypothetical protein